MKKTTLILSLIAAPLMAQTISDVPTIDGAYPAVERMVKEGYLPLYQNKFKPTQAINRKEFALAVDKVIDDLSSKSLQLNKAQVQELTHLSHNYKAEYTTLEQAVADLRAALDASEENNKMLTHDLNRIKEESKKEKMLMWIGIGAATILGMIF